MTDQKANQVFSYQDHKTGSPSTYEKAKKDHNVDVIELGEVKKRLAVPKTWAERHKFYNDSRMMKDGVIISRGGTDLIVSHINSPDQPKRKSSFAEIKKQKQQERMNILKHNVIMLQSKRVGYNVNENPTVISDKFQSVVEKKLKFNKDVMKIESPTSLLKPKPKGQCMTNWTHSNHPSEGFFDKTIRSPYFKSVEKEVDSPYQRMSKTYKQSKTANITLKNSSSD